MRIDVPAGLTRGAHAAAGLSPAARRAHRRQQARGGRVWWIAAMLCAAALVAVALFAHFRHVRPRMGTAVASLPYWSFSNGTDTVLANRQDFNEVSPFIYGLSSERPDRCPVPAQTSRR